MNIKLTWSTGETTITLMDTPSAKALVAALPFDGVAQTWGEEVYFSTPPLNITLEDSAQQVVEPGTVCYWVEGNALALPFGPTPISTDDKPCLVSPCNVLGKLDAPAKTLAQIKSGEKLRVTKD